MQTTVTHSVDNNMPTFSVELPSQPLYPWTFEAGFGVVLGKLKPKRDETPMVMGVPRGVVIRGSEPRVLRTPIHWTIFRDTLAGADQMELFTGALVQIDGSRELVVRTADTRASQWAGLFYQAHPRIVLRPNSPGDAFKLNGHWREEPVTLPFIAGQRVTFDSTERTFAGVTALLEP